MAVVVKGKNKNRPYTVRYRDEERQRERNLRTKTGWQARGRLALCGRTLTRGAQRRAP